MNSDEAHRDEMLREYSELRAEMLQKIELCNNLIIFMYTCTATILGISTSLDNPMVSLVPLLVIMPTSLRIAYSNSLEVGW